MQQRQVFAALNGLRGVAAVMVVIFHSSLQSVLHLDRGYMAVDLFFALSGFVIAHSYEDRLSGSLGVGRFMIIRLIRLYPLYSLGVAVSIAIAVASVLKSGLNSVNAIAIGAIPFNILLVPTPPSADISARLYTLNHPAWSLLFELIVNLAYALTVRFWNIGRLVVVVLISGALALAHYSLTGSLYGEGGITWSSFHLGLLRVVYSFAAGVLAFRIYQARPTSLPIPTWPLLLVLPLALIAAPAATAPILTLIGFPALVFLAARSRQRPWEQVACAWLGAASYAIYALHEPLLSAVHISLPKLLHVGALTGPDVALIVVLVPAAVFLDRWFDAPTRRWLTGLLDRSTMHRARAVNP